MKYFFLLFCLVLISNVYSDFPEPFTVMHEKGLYLFQEPSSTSQQLIHLPFGSIIKTRSYYQYLRYYKSNANINQYYKFETINGVKGFWIDADYNGKLGFVFSPYVYPGKLVKQEIKQKETRLTLEFPGCTELDYHPQLNWFGLYNRNDEFYLEKINLHLLLSNVDTEYNYISEVYIVDFLLNTGLSEQSSFLIGTNYELIETKVPTLYFNKYSSMPRYSEGFLFPEQQLKFTYENKFYRLYALEETFFDSLKSVKKEYHLTLTCSDLTQKIEPITEELTFDLFWPKSAKEHREIKSPNLHWVGDINSDNNLDFIFFTQNRYTYGYILYSIEQIENKLIMKKVDSTGMGPQD